jgi:hypothetical protein
VLEHPRVHLHFTPTSTSWINLVECWFSLLQRRALACAAFTSTDALETALRGYIAATNAAPKPFVWTKSADEILASVKRYYQRASRSTTRSTSPAHCYRPALQRNRMSRGVRSRR